MCPQHDFPQAMRGRKGGGEPILDRAASHFPPDCDCRQGAALQFIVRLGAVNLWQNGEGNATRHCRVSVHHLMGADWQPPTSTEFMDMFANARQWHCCTGGRH